MNPTFTGFLFFRTPRKVLFLLFPVVTDFCSILVMAYLFSLIVAFPFSRRHTERLCSWRWLWTCRSPPPPPSPLGAGQSSPNVPSFKGQCMWDALKSLKCLKPGVCKINTHLSSYKTLDKYILRKWSQWKKVVYTVQSLSTVSAEWVILHSLVRTHKRQLCYITLINMTDYEDTLGVIQSFINKRGH